jgi:hypothetical protein
MTTYIFNPSSADIGGIAAEWDWDSGWQTYPGHNTDTQYTHSQGTSVFSSATVMFRQNGYTSIYNGGFYCHDYAPGEYVLHWGFHLSTNDTSTIWLTMQVSGVSSNDGGGRRPYGWSSDTPVDVRILLKI